MALATGSSIAIALSPNIGLCATFLPDLWNRSILNVCVASSDLGAFRVQGALTVDFSTLLKEY